MESTGRVVYLVDSTEHGSHFPVLERFGGDILFIGDVLPPNELLQDSTNLPPVSEIVVKHKTKSGRETRRAAKVSYDEGLRRTKEVAPMLNPYLNAKKRGQDGSQKQTDAAAQLAGKRNPFASFVVRGKENEKRDNGVARRSNHKLNFVKSAANGIGVKAFLDKLLPPPHQEQEPLPRERATIHESQSERSTRHHQHDYEHEVPSSDKYSKLGTKRQRLSEPACQQLHDYGSRKQPIDLDNMLEQDAHSHQAGLYEQVNAFQKSSCDSEYNSQEPAHPSFRRYKDERRGQSYPAHKAPSTFYDLCGSETVTDQSSRTMNRPLSHADTTLSYRSSVHSSVRRDDLEDVSVVRRQGILPLQPSEGLLDPHAQHTQSSSSNVPPINAADNQDPFDVQDRSFSLGQDVPLFNRHIHDMAGTCLADTNECPRRITNEFAKSLYPPPLAMPAASPQKQRPSFAYDEWLESPQIKDQIMNARELQADDILSSPESFSMRPSNSTNPDRPLIMATNTIGPAKTFRNRFQSTNPQGARKGLIPVRAKQRNGPLQGSLSRYFSRRN
ncbi:hypothetical protein MPSEU_000905100 [Mayamaea pseudoterrestris]|nr:hypothetical protein MPSEU_000905100 [Mayamaea pseudoterrestris]